MSKKILIDGDILAYRCLAAATDTRYDLVFDDETISSFPAGRDEQGKTGKAKADEAAAQFPLGHVDVVKVVTEPPIAHVGHLINEVLDGVRDALPLDPKNTFMYLSAEGPTWRHKLFPEYKAKRPEKPAMLPEVRKMLMDKYGAETYKDYEADDAISLVFAEERNATVVTVDKDFKQLEGVTLFEPFKKTSETIDPLSAWLNLWTQVIAGDSIDNIRGVPGVGVKGAMNFLADAAFEDPMEVDEGQLIEGALHLYTEAELGIDDMLLTYRLVKLLEREDEKDELPWWYNEFKDNAQ